MKLSSTVKTASLILGIAFSIFAVSLVVFAATTWVGPPGPPPNCPANVAGCDTPIHTGTASQVKGGNLGIGIGTATPRGGLDVSGQIIATPRLTLAQDTGVTTRTWHLDNSLGLFRIFDQPNINTPGALRLAITADGNVGIGTANPGTARLKIEGGVLDMTTQRITNVASPMHISDVATKGYVNTQTSGGGRLGVWHSNGTTRLGDFINGPVPWTCANTSYVQTDGTIVTLRHEDCVAKHTSDLFYLLAHCSGNAYVEGPMNAFFDFPFNHQVGFADNRAYAIPAYSRRDRISGVCTNLSPYTTVTGPRILTFSRNVCGTVACRIR